MATVNKYQEGIADDVNTLTFRDNRVRNKVCIVVTPKNLSNSIYSNGDVVFGCRMSKHELVQGMMFVNTCVKIHGNQIRNKKSVKFDDDLVFAAGSRNVNSQRM